MGKVRVAGFGVSIDGFGAGPDQSLEHPLGKRGPELMSWFFPTWAFRSMVGQEGGTDDRFASAAMEGFGAFILGRNMFAHSRGPWTDDGWKGWWDDNPPYHAPTFILTHHPRDPIEMEGGTTFHFIDASPAEALERAREAANGLDVRLGGGATTILDFLAAGLVDHMHVVVVPILLGRGVRLWDGLEALEKDYEIEATSSPSGVTHVTFTRVEAAAMGTR